MERSPPGRFRPGGLLVCAHPRRCGRCSPCRGPGGGGWPRVPVVSESHSLYLRVPSIPHLMHPKFPERPNPLDAPLRPTSLQGPGRSVGAGLCGSLSWRPEGEGPDSCITPGEHPGARSAHSVSQMSARESSSRRWASSSTFRTRPTRAMSGSDEGGGPARVPSAMPAGPGQRGRRTPSLQGRLQNNAVRRTAYAPVPPARWPPCRHSAAVPPPVRCLSPGIASQRDRRPDMSATRRQTAAIGVVPHRTVCRTCPSEVWTGRPPGRGMRSSDEAVLIPMA